MIEFRGVGKAFPDGTEALRALSLTARAGEVTVLVGPSGCGKTTSLRMVNRMVEPTSGQVLLDGADVADADPPELRRGIGYVIQDAGLFPHRTVADNVVTVPVLRGARRREARGRAGELLERVGLEAGLGSRYPAQLSGGQRQRVGVARALADDPPVLLMDEPFSAVDPVVRTELQDELLRLQGELGKTILFVTHDIDEAIRLGDAVAVMRRGGVLAQVGAPRELLAEPVDDFVASFVGRDRGYRRLGFVGAADLPLLDLPTGHDGSAGGWTVVLDDGRPAGWRAPDGTAHAGGSLYVVDERQGAARSAGRTVPGGSLREALDAALSSPSGLGLAVDADGRAVGAIDPRTVLDRLAAESGGSAGSAEATGRADTAGTPR